MKKDLFEEIKKVKKEADNVLNKLFLTDRYSIYKGFREPIIDFKESKSNIVAFIELPGVDKKDVHLSISENSLEIRAEKREEMREEKEEYIRAVKYYNGFYRSIYLPSNVSPEKSKAVYKNGVLEVVMPKTSERKKTKKIEIQ